MAAATAGFYGARLQPGDVTVDEQGVTWEKETATGLDSYNYWADVTSLVKSKINSAPPGTVDFTINEAATDMTDGVLLVVIFDDPAQTTDNTVMLMFGAQQSAGDELAFDLANPIDLTDPNIALDFSLAISGSAQDVYDQHTEIDVNGQRLTSWAGGSDDGTTDMDGALFTVGGLGDSNANPPDPMAHDYGDKRYDDELYSLLPFVSTGDTRIALHTESRATTISCSRALPPFHA